MAIDIIICIVAIAAAIIGFCKGLLSQIGNIVGLVAGIIACRTISGIVIAQIGLCEAPPTWVYAAVHISVFIAAYLIVYLIVRLIRSAVHAIKLGIFDRLGGAIFKTFLWLLLLSIAFNAVIFITNDRSPFIKENMPWREAILKLAPTVLGYVIDRENIPSNEDVKDIINGI